MYVPVLQLMERLPGESGVDIDEWMDSILHYTGGSQPEGLTTLGLPSSSSSFWMACLVLLALGRATCRRESMASSPKNWDEIHSQLERSDKMGSDDARVGRRLVARPDPLVAPGRVSEEKPLSMTRLAPLSYGARRSGLPLGPSPLSTTARSLPAERLPARRGYSPAVLPEISDLPSSLPRPLDLAAHSPLSRRLREAHRPHPPDYWLILTVIGLLVIGLVMVYSASQFASPGDPGYWLRHQFVWALLGGGALLLTVSIDYRRFRSLALPGILLAFLLLLTVLLVGHSVSGGQRWLSFGAVSIQPSELVKLLLVIYFAHWLVCKGELVQSLSSGLVPFAMLLGSVLVFVVLQNDVGTSLVIALTGLAMFYAAGARFAHLVVALAAGACSYLVIILATSFRRARFEAFLHPLPPGCGGSSSYQLCQGLISLGSGGITGRGLGDSVQKAGYLPNPFTDGIFAITGEELGLLGCVAIIILFVIMTYRGLQIARHAGDPFGSLLACGITYWFVIQAAINIGSVIDLIPYTGVPLPFVSFGGSSLITSLAAVGILLNISRHTQRESANGE
jgi:cell division protein FtsW